MFLVTSNSKLRLIKEVPQKVMFWVSNNSKLRLLKKKYLKRSCLGLAVAPN